MKHRFKNEATPQTFYFQFEADQVGVDSWTPEVHGYTAWRPMTGVQRFVSGDYILSGSSLNPGAKFCFKKESTDKILVYDPSQQRLTALMASNAMGVR